MNTFGDSSGSMRRIGATCSRRGFSLVVTVTLLVLLSLIAVGVLTLSSLQVRRSGLGDAQAEARANARLALMLAIGELQEGLGPDQRVSGPASLVDDDTTNPHWVGVWKTTRENGDSWYRRDGREGGLKDDRWASDWNAEQQMTHLLVSGNEGALQFGVASALSDDNAVWLVDEGSVGESDRDKVRAPLVETDTEGSGRGAYAYWVGDLGTRANLAVQNAYEGATPRNGRWDMEWMQILMAQDAAGEAVEKGFDVPNESRGRWLTSQQLELLEGQTTEALSELGEARFHDITHYSRGVLANTRDGGLKRDLTAFLASDGNITDLTAGGETVSQGLSVEDNLVLPTNSRTARTMDGVRWILHRHRVTSPKYGLLHSWARAGEQISFGNEESNALLPKPEPIPGPMADSYDFLNENPVSLMDVDSASLAPVLVEGSIYYNISAYEDAETDRDYPWALRLHLYPRLVLWNPYNMAMKLDPLSFYLMINGAKDLEFVMDNGDDVGMTMDIGLGGALRGSLLFSVEPTTLEPGECLVFSPGQPAPYNGSDFSRNILTSRALPDPALCFYLDATTGVRPPLRGSGEVPNGRLPGRPRFFREVFDQNLVQADDYRMLLKRAERGSWGLESFRKAHQVQFVSCALQYGDDDEFPVVWNENTGVPVEFTTKDNPLLSAAPDRRTRDGFRLRWFEEHRSNILGSGSLVDFPQHFQSASIANWNVRSTYSLRSPWENVTDEDPVFFGTYTRDLFDSAVSWGQMTPVFANGKALGNPFGQPQEGAGYYVLFDVPRREVDIVSLGQLQHVKFSEYVWHPSYAFGNSLADPRLFDPQQGEALLDGTELRRAGSFFRRDAGWNLFAIGWPDEVGARGDGPEKWAFYARGLLQNVMSNREEATVSYDLSFELNHALWDDFFLSTGDRAQKRRFWENPSADVLPNGRLRLLRENAGDRGESLTDFHRAASCLMLDGAFNVNSTSVEAWKAVLSATRGVLVEDEVAFSRVLNAPGGAWSTNESVEDSGAWRGYRVLDDDEIQRLAEEVVTEVKERGPFLSLSDFVNRRLRNDETGRKGPLQASIDRAGLNDSFSKNWPLNNEIPIPQYFHRDHIRYPARIDQTLKPDSVAWGVPGYLTQADVLQLLGPVLTARSDSFVIRGYGEARDGSGNVTARAWCEATLQRYPDPVVADETGLNPLKNEVGNTFGRRFRMVSFRWLHPSEV